MRWDSENDLNSTPSTSVLLHKQNTGPSPSLEDVVRRRTPIWIQGLLKTHIDEDRTLEELFANCWLLCVEFLIAYSYGCICGCIYH